MGDHQPRPPAEVGIRELKTSASAIVNRVRRGRPYLITHRGRPVAAIVPLPTQAHEDAWSRLHAAGEEVARQWTSSKSSLEILDEVRR